MLSNAYFLAKFYFDTAENEPAKNCNITNLQFPNNCKGPDPRGAGPAAVARGAPDHRPSLRPRDVPRGPRLLPPDAVHRGRWRPAERPAGNPLRPQISVISAILT